MQFDLFARNALPVKGSKNQVEPEGVTRDYDRKQEV